MATFGTNWATFGTNWPTFGTNWATYYSGIWSHLAIIGSLVQVFSNTTYFRNLFKKLNIGSGRCINIIIIVSSLGTTINRRRKK